MKTIDFSTIKTKHNAKNITGERFGKLIVESVYGFTKNRKIIWNCICDCGKNTTAIGAELRKGHKSSCGCLYRKHGHNGNVVKNTYTTWLGIKQRCLNEKSTHYENYGGRGIKICDRWLNYINFFEDMGEKPEGLSIERINNDGNYEPSNCRWATSYDQANNRRNTYFLTYEGITLSISDWATKFKINRATIRSRINRGYSIHDALTKPLNGSAPLPISKDGE